MRERASFTKQNINSPEIDSIILSPLHVDARSVCLLLFCFVDFLYFDSDLLTMNSEQATTPRLNEIRSNFILSFTLKRNILFKLSRIQ